MARILGVLILTFALAAGPRAQVQVESLLDLVGTNSGEEDVTNVTFTEGSPFHSVRARLFFDAPLDQRNAAFVQVLIDDYKFSLYGAYVRLGEVVGPYVNFNVGLIPSTIGNFGPRTYSNKNPLIGTPLLWVHHTSWAPVLPNQPRTVDELVAARESRSNMGLPVLYDNCWNTGVELYGSAGPIDYSLAALSGSVTKPTLQQFKDIPQFTARIAYVFGPALTFGLSGFAGPYLWEGLFRDDLPAGKQATDFLNMGGGYDLAFARGHLEVYSELFYTVWEHPYIENLTAAAGYVEARYKFRPQWYAAGRLGFFEPGRVTNGVGEEVHWDLPVRRYEVGAGYHASRRVIVKGVVQINRSEFSDVIDTEHYAVQLSAAL